MIHQHFSLPWPFRFRKHGFQKDFTIKLLFIVFAKLTSPSIPMSQCSVFWDDHWLELDVLYKISIPLENQYISLLRRRGQTVSNPRSALPKCFLYIFPWKPIVISLLSLHLCFIGKIPTRTWLSYLLQVSFPLFRVIYLLSFSHFPSIVWSYFFRLIKVGQIVCFIQLLLQHTIWSPSNDIVILKGQM